MMAIMVGAFEVCLLFSRYDGHYGWCFRGVFVIFSRYDGHYPFKSVIVELLVAGRKHPMVGWTIYGFSFFSAKYFSHIKAMKG